MNREFDFLPDLPKPDLDDRTFQDLVNECLLRIPRYCPEWTNYNPSDPGITLIELFAWLTDQMLLRFNQVPRRNYVTFLELLGIRLQAPQPSKTNVTFYLSTASNYIPEPNRTIPGGTEVATERTEKQEAVIFATDRNLVIGEPKIRHLLTAQEKEKRPQILRDRFSSSWTQQPDDSWSGLEQAFFEEQPQPGNCFYLVFNPDQPIEGNVINLTIKGESATSTGINPERPPRHWEAWNGSFWESVLLTEEDDSTEGFSFSKLTRNGGDPLQGADILLHLPQHWPETTFVTYHGRWLRCIHTQPDEDNDQPGYARSPRIVGLSVRSVGGTVSATQSTLVENEILGESNGNPGQTFFLQRVPVLPRELENEHILVITPGGEFQTWKEVQDFADSETDDLHYTIDSLSGRVQFGPLIREPAQIKESTLFRSRLQRLPTEEMIVQNQDNGTRKSLKRQHGKVPPRGSTIQMVTYRTGGGQQGNIQSKTIKVLKTAVPYVDRVINHEPALYGTNAESLDAAVIRVPQILRTRDRAVTREDFEALAKKAVKGKIARARCLSPTKKEEAGRMRLLLVPKPNTEAIERGEGINPDQLHLNPQLIEQVSTYLDERRLLGVDILYEQPEYVGVAVQTEVALESEYKNPLAEQEIRSKLIVSLYRFLNPITGGPEGKGWPFGRPVYASDIVKLFQPIAGVRYMGTVQLFELRYNDSTWTRQREPLAVIKPGNFGLVCSWRNEQIGSSHFINLI